MTTRTASVARSSLFKRLDNTQRSHEPVQIMGRRQNAVFLSGKDFRSIHETLFLIYTPGMRESIRLGLRTPASKLSKKLNW